MIQASHIDQAHTRLHEYETLTGYEAGTPEWFEAMGELCEIEPLALKEHAVAVLGQHAPAMTFELRGFITGCLARQYAEAEGVRR